MSLFSRQRREQAIEAIFANPASIETALGEIELPADIAAWLGRLHALIGIPFGYLVPDEAMLPAESIRFFALDEAWIQALLDGAFSLGRNLSASESGAGANLDRVLAGPMLEQARTAAPRRRRAGADVAGSQGSEPWTGFLLRSRVVGEYPGLGVNAYRQGHTPQDPQPELMTLRRLDRLGPANDTLLCLIEGDAHRVDIHEAPELLHYGIDEYRAPSGDSQPKALKHLHTFRRQSDNTIVLCKQFVGADVSSSFRERSPRVLKLSDLAAQTATKNKLETIDSAELGFEMTEGVGMVSFVVRGSR